MGNERIRRKQRPVQNSTNNNRENMWMMNHNPPYWGKSNESDEGRKKRGGEVGR